MMEYSIRDKYQYSIDLLEQEIDSLNQEIEIDSKFKIEYKLRIKDYKRTLKLLKKKTK